MITGLPILDRSPPDLSRDRKGAVRASTDGRQSAVRDLASGVFGVTQFRPLQHEAIQASLEGKDSLCIIPTGGGKSLCYQLPALLDAGLTLVVSPLIALMKDQVDALCARNLPAAFLNSTLHPRQQTEIMDDAQKGRIHLLYVSAERCEDPAFLAFLDRCALRAFVIDEAHCVSVWGSDFRPSYGKLNQLRVLFPHVPIQAFTATATPRVRAQITQMLALDDPVILVGDFDRPNLILYVFDRDPENADAQLVDVIRQLHSTCAIPHASSADGIIYCNTRAETERLADLLETAPSRDHEGAAFDVRPYHAGLSDDARRRAQDWFMSASHPERSEGSRIIVATVAFGMGLDKADVRFVIHFGMPPSLDIYHQEIGRAGRDGEAAECVMLYHLSDYHWWIRLLNDNCTAPGTLEGRTDALADMECFVGRTRRSVRLPACRHAHLCEYFGQPYQPPSSPRGDRGGSGCNACDVCLSEPGAEATGRSKPHAPARGRSQTTKIGVDE